MSPAADDADTVTLELTPEAAGKLRALLGLTRHSAGLSGLYDRLGFIATLPRFRCIAVDGYLPTIDFTPNP